MHIATHATPRLDMPCISVGNEMIIVPPGRTDYSTTCVPACIYRRGIINTPTKLPELSKLWRVQQAAHHLETQRHILHIWSMRLQVQHSMLQPCSAHPPTLHDQVSLLIWYSATGWFASTMVSPMVVGTAEKLKVRFLLVSIKRAFPPMLFTGTNFSWEDPLICKWAYV